MIYDINKDFNFDFNFKTPDKYEVIIPELDINFFLDFKKDKKIIIYYNDLPKSGQKFPYIKHDEVIDYLADIYNDYIIITSLPSNIKKSNVISLDFFNIEYTPCCKNIYYTIYFAMNSDLVFSYDVGATFIYNNNKINDLFKGKWYHITSINYKLDYYYLLNKYLNNPNIYNLKINSLNDFKMYIKK